MTRNAAFSNCGRYRYRLRRTWDESKAVMAFVMLNPSKADGVVDDATIRRCCRFARDAGYGGIVVVNLCALVSTDPRALHVLPLEETVGPKNDTWIYNVIRFTNVGVVVCAWGANVAKHPGLQIRAQQVLSLINEAGAQPHILRMTKSGQPEHPLRLPATLRPQPWKPDLTAPPAWLP